MGTTVPWTAYQSTPLWWRVSWMPLGPGFVPPGILRDMAVNVLLYVPFGFFGRSSAMGARASIVSVLALAAALSSTTECIQLFNPTRFPALTDVAMNITGAFFGAVIAAIHPPPRTSILLPSGSSRVASPVSDAG